ncbi:putative ribonuclease H-like domain-containing protein [Tanacetum coccineum]
MTKRNGSTLGNDHLDKLEQEIHQEAQAGVECRAPRNQDNRGKENSKRTMTIESSTENALVAQDGIGGYDWSYQAEEEHPTNFALMAHTSSGSSSSSDSERSYKAGFRLENQEYIDEIVESENMDVTTVITPSDFEKDMSNHESAGVKNNGDAVEPKIRTGKINTAGAKVNTAVRPVNTVGSNQLVKDTTARDRAVVSENKGKGDNDVKASACWVWKAKNSSASNTFRNYSLLLNALAGQPTAEGVQGKMEKAVIDSGCSRHMTGNKCYLDEYEDYDGGFVSFGDGKGRISGKGKIKTGSLDFDDVYFCKELKYNLFSVSQICDKKNNVLFTDTECLVLSSDFKLLDESQVLLRVPRKDNIYSVDLKSVVPTGGLTCLIAKATIDESNTWHRRLGHINFKTMNKLVKGNLVKGLPSKIFENDHSCVACQKGKQHKASYKTKLVNSISKPLHMLHMDLFGPTNVKSLMKKSYCLVVTDDFSRFSWVFFLATKDETSGILKTFITEIENQLDHKVKVIRSDNGTEFKNSIMNQFCEMKGIKREFSMARTPQQNGVAERKNRTLIEAARTMLVDSKLPTTFWAEAVNTACYVLNRVLVIKPHNKTPYELIRGRPPLIDFMKPFGCPVTILNTRDHLGKFDGKADEGYFVGYSVGNKTNSIAGTKDNIVACQAQKEKEHEQEYILIPLCTTDPLMSQGPKDSEGGVGMKPTVHVGDPNKFDWRIGHVRQRTA